jgi:autotransporter-associated beta strand protein
MKTIILTTLTSIGLSLGVSAATIITQWDFNSTPSDGSASTGTNAPSTGSGTLGVLGFLTTVYNAPNSSSDPIGADPNNSGLRLLGNWPASATTASNKTAGVQMNISTVGFQNITLAWDQANSGSASKYYRVLYSIDNGTNWVPKDVVINGTAAINWINPITNISFAAVSGVNNNTNFGVRIVSEFESTAIGSGTVGYVGVLNAYSTANANLRLDMMTFTGDVVTGNVNILADPTDVTVAVGQPASFTVSAGGGTTPITYQWRQAGSPITDATNSVLAFASAQLTNAAGYDVVVANGVNSQTSAVATLTVRTPLNLAWTGTNGATWDTNTASWFDAVSNNVAYAVGDNVLFAGHGVAAPTVSLVGALTPTSVTVDADFNYLLRTDGGGLITGNSGLTKRGTGTLIVDADNTYSGPTVIQAGVVQLGQADAHGSLGSGPITNNGALVVNRTGTVTLGNTITGSGSLTNIGTGTLTLAGVTTYSGLLSANAGSLILSANQTINSPDLFVTASAATGPGGATKFALGGGLVVGASTIIHFTGLTASPDCRATFQSLSGTNIINGPTLLEGTGAAAFETAGIGNLLTVNGNVYGPGFTGTLFLRGANGSGILNGTINLPGCNVFKPDTSTWTINSTNNAWNLTSFTSGGLRLGAHNALPTGLTLLMGVSGSTATLDLAGFNQQVANITDTGGTKVITNSSATTDSTLTVGSGTFGGTIADSASGPKTSLILNGGTFTLSGPNSYSGDTTILAGTLALSGSGDIPNSATINLVGGGVSGSGRFDGTFPVSAVQTLKGNGTLAVTGNLLNNGTIELKVTKSGNTITNDKVSVSGDLNSPGILKLTLSGAALNWMDTIPVFAATTYSASVPTIVPATPAPGATWDTTTLLTDGILRVYGPPTITNTVVGGTNITLGGLGGTASGTFSVLTTTNVALPTASWTTFQNGSFDANGNFSVTAPITPGQPQQFFRLQMP